MKPFLLAFAAVTALLILLLLLLARPAEEKTAPAFPAPAFSWQDFAGKTHNRADHAGRVIVLHFWASWCAPCRPEFPPLLEAAAALPEITFIALSSDRDRAAAEKFLAELKAAPTANFLPGWDEKRHVTYDLFMTAAYPETVILDRRHHLRRKIAGPADWQSAELRAYLRALAAE